MKRAAVLLALRLVDASNRALRGSSNRLLRLAAEAVLSAEPQAAVGRLIHACDDRLSRHRRDGVAGLARAARGAGVEARRASVRRIVAEAILEALLNALELAYRVCRRPAASR